MIAVKPKNANDRLDRCVYNLWIKTLISLCVT